LSQRAVGLDDELVRIDEVEAVLDGGPVDVFDS
jgi:hypothetical protein